MAPIVWLADIGTRKAWNLREKKNNNNKKEIAVKSILQLTNVYPFFSLYLKQRW